jgi:hypothetical protein
VPRGLAATRAVLLKSIATTEVERMVVMVIIVECAIEVEELFERESCDCSLKVLC